MVTISVEIELEIIYALVGDSCQKVDVGQEQNKVATCSEGF